MKKNTVFMRDATGIILGAILMFTPLFRFTWDLLPQTILHILVITAAFAFVIRFKPSWNIRFHGLLILFLLAAFASAVQSSDKANGRNEMFVLVDGIVIAYLASNTPDAMKRTLFAIPVFIGIWFSIVLAVTFVLSVASAIMAKSMPSEIALNQNVVAGYLTLCLPLSFIFSTKRDRLISAGLIFMGIILTGARVAILVSVISLVYCGLRGKDITKRSAFIVLCAAVAALGLFSLSKYMHGNSFHDRLTWFYTALDMFKENALTGAGWGNFGRLFTVYRPAPVLNTLYAHNIFLQMLAETGIAGITIFALIIIGFYRLISSADGIIGFKRSLMTAVTAFLTVNLADYSFYIPGTMMLFWFCVGSVISMQLCKRDSLSKIFRAGAIVFWLGAVWVIVLPYRANVYLQKGIDAMLQSNTSLATSLLNKAVRTDPLLHEPYRRLAELSYRQYTSTHDTGYVIRAIALEAAALRICPVDGRAWADLGVLYWSIGNKSKAIESTRQALTVDRFNPGYADNLRKYESQ